MQEMKHYRYDLRTSAHWATDFNGEYAHVVGYSYSLELRTYYIVKETPKGYWIGISPNYSDRWVSKISRKRFAYPTKEEALVSFEARNNRMMKILNHQLSGRKQAVELIKKERELCKKN